MVVFVDLAVRFFEVPIVALDIFVKFEP